MIKSFLLNFSHNIVLKLKINIDDEISYLYFDNYSYTEFNNNKLMNFIIEEVTKKKPELNKDVYECLKTTKISGIWTSEHLKINSVEYNKELNYKANNYMPNNNIINSTDNLLLVIGTLNLQE